MKLIVYKAHADQYRWRLVDDKDTFIEQSDLIPVYEDALAAAYKKAHEGKTVLEVENRVGRTE